MTRLKKNIFVTFIILFLLIVCGINVKENLIYEDYISKDVYTLTHNISSKILINQKIFESNIRDEKTHIKYLIILKENFASIYNDLRACYEIGEIVGKIPNTSDDAYWPEINIMYFFLDRLVDQTLIENGYETYFNSYEYVHEIDAHTLFVIGPEDKEKLESIKALNTALNIAVLKHLDELLIKDNTIEEDEFYAAYGHETIKKSFWCDMLNDLMRQTNEYFKSEIYLEQNF